MSKGQAAALMGFICVVLAIVSPALPRGRDTPSITRAELSASFAADVRNLAYRWDVDDPTPAEARRAALFDFIYQTYETTAWIPQSLFDGNLISQVIAGDVATIVRDKVGLALWREHPRVSAYGMAPDLRPGAPLRWTVNCLVCHVAEIDGVAYLGAGSKVFDDKWLGEALKTLTSDRWTPLLLRDDDARDMASQAHRILTSHHHEKIDPRWAKLAEFREKDGDEA